LAVIDHFLGIGRDIDGHNIPVLFNDLEFDGFGRRIRQHIIEAEAAVAALAFFGEDFGESFILAFAGAVGAINPDHFLINRGVVGIWILFGRNLGGVSEDSFRIEKRPFVAIVIAACHPRQGSQSQSEAKEAGKQG